MRGHGLGMINVMCDVSLGLRCCSQCSVGATNGLTAKTTKKTMRVGHSKAHPKDSLIFKSSTQMHTESIWALKPLHSEPVCCCSLSVTNYNPLFQSFLVGFLSSRYHYNIFVYLMRNTWFCSLVNVSSLFIGFIVPGSGPPFWTGILPVIHSSSCLQSSVF